MTAISAKPIDLKRTYRALYSPPAVPGLVDVPDLAYLAVDGVGAPESPAYGSAVAALFGVSYTIRGLMRDGGGPVHVVMPLEALWWTPDPAAFRSTPRSGWHWTAMILQPPQVDAGFVAAAIDRLARPLPEVELRRLAEGRSAQVMHHGPYAEEAPTIDALHTFVTEAGLSLNGHHHEIYLTDPRRCEPARMRTVIRYSVAER
jgi:hypothetical protein